MTEARVKVHRSTGSVWRTGELIAGYDPPPSWPPRQRGVFSVLLCLRERVIGPRGGIRQPALMAEIAGPSWAAVKRAIRAQGFTMPRLSATEVRG